MDWLSDLSFVVVGYVLAQIGPFTAWIRRPKLKILDSDAHVISHELTDHEGQPYMDFELGITIRNVGRTRADGLRVQIIGIRVRGRSAVDTLEGCWEIRRADDHTKQKIEPVSLPAGASVASTVAVGDDGPNDYICPAGEGYIRDFDLWSQGIDAFEYDIVAYGDKASVQRTVIVKAPK